MVKSNKTIRSGNQISHEVNQVFKEKKMTLSGCVDAFYRRYQTQISEGTKLAMNKDFLCRVRNNDFKVVSKRVLDLCEFLEINPYEEVREPTCFKREFEKVERVVKQRPELEPKIKSILQSITEIAIVQGV